VGISVKQNWLIALIPLVHDESTTNNEADVEQTQADQWKLQFLSSKEEDSNSDNLDDNRPSTLVVDNNESLLTEIIGTIPELELEGNSDDENALKEACKPNKALVNNPFLAISVPWFSKK
jgi:hypothetical protein